MKLSELAKKPQLVEITIDDADIVEQFGEPLSFYTWDRQPMDTFLKLASIDNSNIATVIDAVRNLILDEAGKPVLTGDATLPTAVMMRVINRVVESLGKL